MAVGVQPGLIAPDRMADEDVRRPDVGRGQQGGQVVDDVKVRLGSRWRIALPFPSAVVVADAHALIQDPVLDRAHGQPRDVPPGQEDHGRAAGAAALHEQRAAADVNEARLPLPHGRDRWDWRGRSRRSAFARACRCRWDAGGRPGGRAGTRYEDQTGEDRPEARARGCPAGPCSRPCHLIPFVCS